MSSPSAHQPIRPSADLLLIAACFLWGTSFVIVKDALAHATPLAFVAARFGLAAIVLAPFALRQGGAFSAGELRGGLLLAGLLGTGFLAQTAGLVHTTPSRSAFIVAISSVLAPAIAAVALRERPRGTLLAALGLAGVGTYLLTAPETGGLNRGDVLTMITAVTFGGQIVAIAWLAGRYDPIRLVWLQVAGTALLGAVGALAVE